MLGYAFVNEAPGSAARADSVVELSADDARTLPPDVRADLPRPDARGVVRAPMSAAMQGALLLRRHTAPLLIFTHNRAIAAHGRQRAPA